MEIKLAKQLATLGHPQRLAIFRLLMRRYPGAVPAGEIAEVLGLKASTLSAYLGALMQAGLIAQQREGTQRRYAIALEAVQGMTGGLLLDCCRGRPDLCLPVPTCDGTANNAPPLPAPPPAQRRNVLFICTRNSARSIMAEAILHDLSGDRFTAFSAGTAAQSALHPEALALLRTKGHNTAPLRAKSLAEFRRDDAPRLDYVITVCDRAANEDCPAWPGQPVTGHFSTPDPVAATGDTASRARAFQQAYDSLFNRIRRFTETVTDADPLDAQRHLDRIAATEGFLT